jgi:hypothetical protein
MRILIATLIPTPNSGSTEAETAAWVLGKELPWRESGETDYGDGIVGVQYTAEVSDEAFETFARDWALADYDDEPNLGAITERGHVSGAHYDFGGDEWNAGGVTPVASVSLFVSEPLTIS